MYLEILLYFFIVSGEVYIFGINAISTLSDLTYKNTVEPALKTTCLIRPNAY